METSRVNLENLSGDKVREMSKSIRIHVQAARDIQLVRFSKIESLHIVANVDMRLGDKAILPIAGRRSGFVTGGNESTQCIG